MVEPKKWEEAKREAKRVLTTLARDRTTIPYSRFVKKIKAIPDLKYHGDERLDSLLDEISLEEDAAGRGLLSVLVVEKTHPYLPSDGFFELATHRHPKGTRHREIFEAERDRVYAAHAEP